ncbi:MAG TPA: hypothetical protein VFK38_02285 [Candidatus Limnocylindrales bacterium]|nr:hypothetical protein [Candidatus Limnocylindrales bacterium]
MGCLHVEPLQGAPALLRALVVALLLAGCAASPPSLDPALPCGGQSERRGPGLVPDLESLLPATLEGAPPVSRESGSYCSTAALGAPLVKAGVAELAFAGARWDRPRGAISLVAYRALGLTANVMADTFATGADAARRISGVQAREVELAGRRGIRIDAQSRDGPLSVVLWPARADDTILAVLADSRDVAGLDAAIAALGER